MSQCTFARARACVRTCMNSSQGSPPLLKMWMGWLYLGDGEGIVEVTERIKLPVLSLNSHKKLLDAFQGELITA